MKTWLIRAFSFFKKEIHEIRRQPRLLLSLIGGPFLVLALFGATFRSANPVLRTVLVWPTDGVPGVERSRIEEVITRNFELVEVVSDSSRAIDMLEKGQADVVQVVPHDILRQIERGERPALEVYSYAIDPTSEVWIRSLAFSEAHYINRQVLLNQTGQAQQQAGNIQVELQDAQSTLSRLEASLTPERQQQAEDSLRTIRGALWLLLSVLPPTLEEGSLLEPRVRSLRRETLALMEDLEELEEVLRTGQIQTETDRLLRVNQQLDRLQGSIQNFSSLPPEVIVSPLLLNYQNLRGQAYNLVVYYAPGVLALLIQHLAITLGALSLVRERLMGSFELFRVAPLSFFHLLFGKTLAYTLYVLAAAAALTLLLQLLNVPFLGSPLLMGALVILLTLASVGIGLLVSSISTTDSQAVQLTMITLLLSIFFTGFFLPVQGFSPLAEPISAAIPMTHGLNGLQQIMLLGRVPGPAVWSGLILTGLAAYLLAFVIARRAYRRVVA